MHCGIAKIHVFLIPFFFSCITFVKFRALVVYLTANAVRAHSSFYIRLAYTFPSRTEADTKKGTNDQRTCQAIAWVLEEALNNRDVS